MRQTPYPVCCEKVTSQRIDAWAGQEKEPVRLEGLCNFIQQLLGVFDVFQEMAESDDVELFDMVHGLGGNVENRETITFLTDLTILWGWFKPDDLEAAFLPYVGDPTIPAANIQEFFLVANDKFID